jgi:hypothetical protein
MRFLRKQSILENPRRSALRAKVEISVMDLSPLLRPDFRFASPTLRPTDRMPGGETPTGLRALFDAHRSAHVVVAVIVIVVWVMSFPFVDTPHVLRSGDSVSFFLCPRSIFLRVGTTSRRIFMAE